MGPPALLGHTKIILGFIFIGVFGVRSFVVAFARDEFGAVFLEGVGVLQVAIDGRFKRAMLKRQVDAIKLAPGPALQSHEPFAIQMHLKSQDTWRSDTSVFSSRAMGKADLKTALRSTEAAKMFPNGFFGGMSDFDVPRKLPRSVALVDILSETAQVQRRTTQFGLVNVHIAVLQSVPGQQEAVNDARFASAIGAIDQSQRTDWDPSRCSKGLEVTKPKAAYTRLLRAHVRQCSTLALR